MRYRIFIYIFFALNMPLIAFKAIGQCKCVEGQINIIYISEDTARKYIANYDTNYRQLEVKEKFHSISVDFSRNALLQFAYTVFEKDAAKNYEGVRMDFSVFNNGILLPGQRSKMQIGLVLSPILEDCTSDSKEMNLMNNSFDQSLLNYKPTSSIKTISSGNLSSYRQNYLTYFTAHGTDQNHSTSVLLSSKVILYVKQFLVDNPSYSGVRIFFASYNQPGVACGQTTPNQITLLIVPTLNNGDTDFNAFKKYAKEKNGFTDDKKVDAFFEALNHGSLCPKVCPQ